MKCEDSTNTPQHELSISAIHAALSPVEVDKYNGERGRLSITAPAAPAACAAPSPQHSNHINMVQLRCKICDRNFKTKAALASHIYYY